MPRSGSAGRWAPAKPRADRPPPPLPVAGEEQRGKAAQGEGRLAFRFRDGAQAEASRHASERMRSIEIWSRAPGSTS